MWTGQQLEPASPIYNTAFLIEIPTAIAGVGFRQSFDTIVRQSKSLRTTIELIQGVPHLKLNDKIDYEFQVLDFSDSDSPLIDAKAWCDARCQRMFDLESCLFETALLKLGDDSYGWYIGQHHLISDAWGATQLWRLLCEVYAQRKSGLQELELDFGPEFPAGEKETLNPAQLGSTGVCTHRVLWSSLDSYSLCQSTIARFRSWRLAFATVGKAVFCTRGQVVFRRVESI